MSAHARKETRALFRREAAKKRARESRERRKAEEASLH